MKTKLFVLSVVAAVGVFVCTSVFAEDLFKDTSEGYLPTPKRPMMAQPFAHKIAQSQAKYVKNAKEPYEGDSPGKKPVITEPEKISENIPVVEKPAYVKPDPVAENKKSSMITVERTITPIYGVTKEPYEGDSLGKKPVTPEVPRIEENHVLPEEPKYVKGTIDKEKELLDMIKERITATNTNVEKVDDYKQGLKVGELELYDRYGNLGAKESYLDENGIPDIYGRIQSSVVYGPENAGNTEIEEIYDYRQDLKIGNVELYDKYGALGAIENYLDGNGIPDINGRIQSVVVYDVNNKVEEPSLPKQDPKIPALSLKNPTAAIRGDTDLAKRLTVVNSGRPQLPSGVSISYQIVTTRSEEAQSLEQR